MKWLNNVLKKSKASKRWFLFLDTLFPTFVKFQITIWPLISKKLFFSEVLSSFPCETTSHWKPRQTFYNETPANQMSEHECQFIWLNETVPIVQSLVHVMHGAWTTFKIFGVFTFTLKWFYPVLHLLKYFYRYLLE